MSVTTNHLGQPLGNSLDGWQAPPALTREPIAGRYCRVEPLETSRHGQALFEANMVAPDGGNWTYLPYGPFEVWSSYLTWLQESCQSSDPMFYAIVDKTHNKAMGVASYLRIAPAIGSIEVGHINFSPPLQQTPAATEAMYLLMKHAFGLGYRRYEWKCDALNTKSRAAAQRLGLSFEGVFRQATIYKGRNRDTAWFAAIDQEWPALQAAFEQWLAPENFDEQGRQRLRLRDLTAPLLYKLDIPAAVRG